LITCIRLATVVTVRVLNTSTLLYDLQHSGSYINVLLWMFCIFVYWVGQFNSLSRSSHWCIVNVILSFLFKFLVTELSFRDIIHRTAKINWQCAVVHSLWSWNSVSINLAWNCMWLNIHVEEGSEHKMNQ
jgi:hypothetical protein